MVGPDRPQFVLFGSSIVQFSFDEGGWGSILANLYARRADIVLRGYAGWNSRQALQALTHIFPKGMLSEYVENMKKIGLYLKGLSETTRVIFLSPPAVNEAQIKECFGEAGAGRTNEGCRRYSEACLYLCKLIDVKGIDLWTALQKRDNWLNTCFTDGIHLTADGSKIVAYEILKALKEADWKPSLHWKSLPIEFDEYGPYGPDGINVAEFNISKEW